MYLIIIKIKDYKGFIEAIKETGNAKDDEIFVEIIRKTQVLLVT